MATLKYVKPERIYLSGHPELNERWVQGRIAEDPSILGLGDLILKDKERIQPHAGRLERSQRRHRVRRKVRTDAEPHRGLHL